MDYESDIAKFRLKTCEAQRYAAMLDATGTLYSVANTEQVEALRLQAHELLDGLLDAKRSAQHHLLTAMKNG